jgi:hypothetical protein
VIKQYIESQGEQPPTDEDGDFSIGDE